MEQRFTPLYSLVNRAKLDKVSHVGAEGMGEKGMGRRRLEGENRANLFYNRGLQRGEARARAARC